LSDFEILLQGIASNPDVPLKNLSFLTLEQQQIRASLEKEFCFDFTPINN
jgi:hypothetical protein